MFQAVPITSALLLGINEASLSVPYSFLSGIYTQGSDLQSLLFWLSSPGSLSLCLQTDPATSVAQRYNNLVY